MSSRIQTMQETSSHQESKTCHLELVGKVEGYDDPINMAVLVPREEGVIAISDDRTIKVWMKRYNGRYWPSICQNTQAACVSMDFSVDSLHLVVGLESGSIMEFKIGDDFNKMNHMRDYIAHSGRVTGVFYVADKQWLLSCGTDKYLLLHCTETGHRRTGYQIGASGSCVQYDYSSSYVFVGDSGGGITVLRLQYDKPEKITVLRKHTGSIQCMAVDRERRLLFSGGADQFIIVWNLADRDYSAIQLFGHLDKVRGLSFCASSNQLLSVGEDSTLVCWDMNKPRELAAAWNESDVCEKCAMPFFWNVKSMWESKTFGGRQHHCRNCGKALCAKCTTHSHIIPKTGFELDVRVCDKCHDELDEEEQVSMVTFHDVKHSAIYLHIDESSKTVLTVGKDRLIKIWDASYVLSHQPTPNKPRGASCDTRR